MISWCHGIAVISTSSRLCLYGFAPCGSTECLLCLNNERYSKHEKILYRYIMYIYIYTHTISNKSMVYFPQQDKIWILFIIVLNVQDYSKWYQYHYKHTQHMYIYIYVYVYVYVCIYKYIYIYANGYIVM